MLDIAALLISLTALFAWLNHRVIRLPSAVGVMSISLVLSLALVALGRLGWGALARQAESLVASVDFSTVLMQGMLSVLLFAGSLHIDLGDLASRKAPIATLATAGVLVSTAVVGLAVWGILAVVGLPLRLIECLVFGALVSPTDPIAVMGILKSARAPKGLEIKITGESLFNDGVGVVVFSVLLGLAEGARPVSLGGIALLFLEEAVGGVAFGLAIGYLTYLLLRSVDNYQVEVLLTLGLVFGGNALASRLHVSGPLAMVAAGLLIGNHGRLFAMSATTRRHLDTFWELLDEILNAVLFVLIGLEVLVLHFRPGVLLASALMIPAVLLARFVSVGLPVSLLRRFTEISPHAIKILTWAGVRGGISVALALSLPPGPARQVFLPMTYVVVLFSILVQGLTLGRVVGRLVGSPGPGPEAETGLLPGRDRHG
jgi:CPA1 family monovalent cation:H+ antiporter